MADARAKSGALNEVRLVPPPCDEAISPSLLPPAMNVTTGSDSEVKAHDPKCNGPPTIESRLGTEKLVMAAQLLAKNPVPFPFNPTVTKAGKLALVSPQWLMLMPVSTSTKFAAVRLVMFGLLLTSKVAMWAGRKFKLRVVKRLLNAMNVVRAVQVERPVMEVNELLLTSRNVSEASPVRLSPDSRPEVISQSTRFIHGERSKLWNPHPPPKKVVSVVQPVKERDVNPMFPATSRVSNECRLERFDMLVMSPFDIDMLVNVALFAFALKNARFPAWPPLLSVHWITALAGVYAKSVDGGGPEPLAH